MDGPFEAQPTVINSPFESLPSSLEGPNQAVVGVSLSSLPRNAISYYAVREQTDRQLSGFRGGRTPQHLVRDAV